MKKNLLTIFIAILGFSVLIFSTFFLTFECKYVSSDVRFCGSSVGVVNRIISGYEWFFGLDWCGRQCWDFVTQANKEDTVMLNETEKMIIKRIYKNETWYSDQLLNNYPIYNLNFTVNKKISNEVLSGYRTDKYEVEITYSEWNLSGKIIVHNFINRDGLRVKGEYGGQLIKLSNGEFVLIKPGYPVIYN